jgi:hypothetical protein
VPLLLLSSALCRSQSPAPPPLSPRTSTGRMQSSGTYDFIRLRYTVDKDIVNGGVEME